MPAEFGDDFQRRTKHTREKLVGGSLDWSHKPARYKTYPTHRPITLPRSVPAQGPPLGDLLTRRKSIRAFTPKPLTLPDLALLLWASTGIQRQEHGYEFRTVPSAGALYPIETYLVANHVDGLEQGLYHYNIQAHALEELRTADLTDETAHAALDQDMCAAAAVVFIWTAVFQRSKWKYGPRAYRYVYLDAGHIAQNLALSAVSLALGTCQIAAFYDDEMNRLLGVDGDEESVIYLSVVGHPQ